VLQYIHPGLAASVDVAAGYYSKDKPVLSLDDPNGTGFDLQRLELDIRGGVDRYLQIEVSIAFPHVSSVVVDEAHATTMRLPGGFRLRGGLFRAGFGQQNRQHLDQLDFVRRPLPYTYFLGYNGLRGPGAEISWLAPRLPFDLELSLAALSVEVAPPNLVLQTFGGGERWDFAYVAAARGTFRIKDATSLSLGFQYARGKTSQRVTQTAQIPGMIPGSTVTAESIAFTPFDNFYTHLIGADLTVAWHSRTRSALALTWQTEYYIRLIPNLVLDGNKRPQTEGGAFTQLVLQLARSWLTGLRLDAVGIPRNTSVKTDIGLAAMVTWRISSWSQLRAHGEVRFPQVQGEPVNGAVFLQLQASLGIGTQP
jgi:hypothetical protein